ncbi:MAG: 1,4-dihydroxy-2-naphthoyl-CoA synthase [Acidimicrobiales bacterium]
MADKVFVSELFNRREWQDVPAAGALELADVTYHRARAHGTVRVAINRPEVRNAFRPRTVDELYMVLDHARQSPDVGCVLLTGNGPSSKDGGWAFSSGGDQRVRGAAGYEYEDGGEDVQVGQGQVGQGRQIGPGSQDRQFGPGSEVGQVGPGRQVDPGGQGSQIGQGGSPAGAARVGRLHILEVQRLIRFMPKVVIAVVPGWAAGGGHSLHVVCDLTLASAEHARFRQTDADVASFDGGFGSAYLARQVGQKRAREVFFAGRTYDAEEAYRMGMVNAVVPHAELEKVALEWAAAVNARSPMSVRMLKYAFNLVDDGLVGQQLFAGEATRLAYMTEEAAEGRDAFLGHRAPDWSSFPWYY